MGFMTGLGGVYVKVPGIHKGRLSWEDSSCPRGFPGFFFPTSCMVFVVPQCNTHKAKMEVLVEEVCAAGEDKCW